MKNKLTKFDTYAIILGTAGLGYLTYRAVKKIKENRAKKKSEKEREAEYKQFATKEKLSYTASSYENIAKRIYNAYDQNYGIYNSIFDSVNEKEIYNAFDSIKNNLDFLELRKVWGRRPIPTAFFRLVVDPVDLETWLTNALSENERATLRSRLRTKNISIQI